jgi:hypothetical protein
LDKFLGATENCILSAEGVSVRGQRFHDSAVTTALLDRLLKYAAKRDQRAGYLSSGRIPVLATLHAADCGFVDVWDFSRNEQVRLPNVDIPQGQGVSWYERGLERKSRKKRQREYESWDDALVRRAEFNRSIDDVVRNGSFRDARKHARILEARAARKKDATVQMEEAVEPPTIEGNSEESIPMTIPAFERLDERRKPKAPRRGGRKASAKAAKARADKRKASQQQVQKVTASDEVVYQLPEEFEVEEPEAMLDRLAKAMR